MVLRYLRLSVGAPIAPWCNPAGQPIDERLTQVSDAVAKLAETPVAIAWSSGLRGNKLGQTTHRHPKMRRLPSEQPDLGG